MLRALCLFLLLSITIGATAQVSTIVNGTVTDSSGDPLIGVSITEKGSTQGTITDIDGKYSIKIAPDAILLFSYLGYSSEEIAVN